MCFGALNSIGTAPSAKPFFCGSMFSWFYREQESPPGKIHRNLEWNCEGMAQRSSMLRPFLAPAFHARDANGLPNRDQSNSKVQTHDQ